MRMEEDLEHSLSCYTQAFMQFTSDARKRGKRGTPERGERVGACMLEF